MISISTLRSCSYYLDHETPSSADAFGYYDPAHSEGGTPARWFGAISSDDGLHGTRVQELAFIRAYHGFDPNTGEPVARNADRLGLSIALCDRRIRALEDFENPTPVQLKELSELHSERLSLRLQLKPLEIMRDELHALEDAKKTYMRTGRGPRVKASCALATLFHKTNQGENHDGSQLDSDGRRPASGRDGHDGSPGSGPGDQPGRGGLDARALETDIPAQAERGSRPRQAGPDGPVRVRDVRELPVVLSGEHAALFLQRDARVDVAALPSWGSAGDHHLPGQSDPSSDLISGLPPVPEGPGATLFELDRRSGKDLGWLREYDDRIQALKDAIAMSQGARRPGIDLTISAPKNFSLFCECAAADDPVFAKRLEGVFDKAVEEAMRVIEFELAETRLGPEERVASEGLQFAVFAHDHGRPSLAEDGSVVSPDFFKHRHVVVMNSVKHGEKRLALFSDKIERERKRVDAMIQARLASGLRDLGVCVESRSGDGGAAADFIIKGMTREIELAHSTRHKMIVERAGEGSDNRAKNKALLDTRLPKSSADPELEREAGRRAIAAQLLETGQRMGDKEPRTWHSALAPGETEEERARNARSIARKHHRDVMEEAVGLPLPVMRKTPNPERPEDPVERERLKVLRREAEEDHRAAVRDHVRLMETLVRAKEDSWVIDRLTNTDDFFTECDVLRECWALAVATGEDREAVEERASRIMGSKSLAHELDEGQLARFKALGGRDRDGNRLFMSSRAVEWHKALLADHAKAKSVASAFGADEASMDRALAEFEKSKGFKLRDDQAAVFRAFCRSGSPSCSLLNAPAGSGKTTAMEAVAAVLRPQIEAVRARELKAVEESVKGLSKKDRERALKEFESRGGGARIIGCAPTNSAASELSKSMGLRMGRDGMSIQALCRKLDPGAYGAVADSEGRLRSSGRRGAKKPLTLNAGDVIVVDEAGLVGTKDMAVLMSAVAKSGATIRLIGDFEQIGSVSPGQPFRAMMEAGGAEKLNTITRQKVEWMRLASEASAAGRSAELLAAYEDNGRLVVCGSDKEKFQTLAKDWLASTRPDKDGNPIAVPVEERLVVATRNADKDAINDAIQTKAKEAGLVTDCVSFVTKTFGKEKTIEVGVGTRLQFAAKIDRTAAPELFAGDGHDMERAAARPRTPEERERVENLCAQNSEMGTVKEIRPSPTGGYDLRVLKDGEEGDGAWINTRAAGYLRLGFCVTAHSAQGKTFDSVQYCHSSFVSSELFYVAATRHRHEFRMYATPDERESMAADVASKAVRVDAASVAGPDGIPSGLVLGQALSDEVTKESSKLSGLRDKALEKAVVLPKRVSKASRVEDPGTRAKRKKAALDARKSAEERAKREISERSPLAVGPKADLRKPKRVKTKKPRKDGKTPKAAKVADKGLNLNLPVSSKIPTAPSKLEGCAEDLRALRKAGAKTSPPPVREETFDEKRARMRGRGGPDGKKSGPDMDR